MHLSMLAGARRRDGRLRAQRGLLWAPGLALFAMMAAAVAGGGAAQEVRFDAKMLVRGMGGESIDLSRFERPNVVTPGQYRVDVQVNGRWRGTLTMDFRGAGPEGARPCYTAELLSSMGLDMHKVERQGPELGVKALGEAPSCGDLSDYVPGAEAKFDMAEQTLSLTVPAYYLTKGRAGTYVDPAYWDRGIPAARLNYSANFYAQDTDGRRNRRGYVNLNGVVNAGAWRLKHDGFLRWSSRDGARYSRGQLYAVTDLPAWRSQLLLGETSTDGRYFDAVSFRGVRLASEERMLPDDRRGYVPTVRGTARTNAAVSVYQRGFLVYETTVAPGPFAIEDLGAASFGGDLTVRVTEANGETWSFIVPFATTVELLRRGETRYSVAVGQATSSGYRSSGQRVFEGLVRAGVSDQVTAYGGLALSDYYGSALAGAALNTQLGAFSGDVTLASANLPGERTSGSSYRVSYSKNLPNSGTNFSLLAYRYSTSGFVGLNEAIALRDAPHSYRYADLGRLRNRLDVNINQDLGARGGSFYLNGSALQYWRRSGSAFNYGMGYRNSWGKVSYALALQRVQDLSSGGELYMPGRGRSTVATLNLSFPLGSGKSINTPSFSSYTSHSSVGGTDAAASVAGGLGDDGRLSYSLSASRNSRSDTAAASGSLDYRAAVANMGVNVSQGSGYRQAGLRAQGSVLAHAGGVTLSPTLGETVGLVLAPDAEDARIGFDRSRVDGRGYGLATSLAPYRLNTVELDPSEMADDVELLASSRTVAPRAGAVVLLRYPTRRARPVLVNVRRPDGSVLPFGAEVFDLASGESVGAVGQGSRIIMRVSQDHGDIRVQWGPDAEQRCLVGYRLPPRQGRQDGFDTLDAVCQPEPEPAPPAIGSPVAAIWP
ncbi:MAG: fimbria/pilus outer membrane usher protein [Achromobacter sp.]|uniref:fimbria/pilus outer membrane usher protein n=1 Tax=Achromobacter sp. TaxID=134375 RepID=UPI003D023733